MYCITITEQIINTINYLVSIYIAKISTVETNFFSERSSEQFPGQESVLVQSSSRDNVMKRNESLVRSFQESRMDKDIFIYICIYICICMSNNSFQSKTLLYLYLHVHHLQSCTRKSALNRKEHP